MAADSLKLLMWERRHHINKKEIFFFVSLIFTLYIFTPNIDSACVLAPVDAGGKPSCDDAGTFYCGLHVCSSARARWADAPAAAAAGESARWVTRAVRQQLGRNGGCTRVLKATVLQWCKEILDERYESHLRTIRTVDLTHNNDAQLKTERLII